jgi:hypothetical protein
VCVCVCVRVFVCVCVPCSINGFFSHGKGGFMLLFQGCYKSVTRVLEGCKEGVTRVIRVLQITKGCYRRVCWRQSRAGIERGHGKDSKRKTNVLHECYKGVTRVLQGCYRRVWGVARVL